MNLLLHIAVIFSTLLSTIGPDDHSTAVVERPVVESVGVEYIHKTIKVDNQEYIWTIMIPSTAVRGGAGLLFLHGIGSSGDDGALHIEYGLPPAIEKNPEAWPFIVIAPQKPTRSDWDFHESAVMEMLDVAIEEGFVDADRIAVTGLSQGGRGTLLLASMYPDRFVAAAPVCGYAQIAFDEDGQRTAIPSMKEYQDLMADLAKKLKKTPIWLFHGDADRVVPVMSSRAMNFTLKSVGADVQYTEFEGVDHNAWDPAYAKEELGEWFQEHLAE